MALDPKKVVWSEGMFLRPQHFQQEARYFEGLVEARCESLRRFAWGFSELEIDQSLLKSGKLVVAKAKGLFPDGTPFVVSPEAGEPLAINVEADIRDKEVFLGLPLVARGSVEVDEQGADGGGRYRPVEVELRDSNAGMDITVPVQLAQPKAVLFVGAKARPDHVSLGVAKVREVLTDRQVVLDDGYIAPVLTCHTSPVLRGFLNEVCGMLGQRGDALAGQVSASGRGGAGEIVDFLMLQSVNRYEALLQHLSALRTVHPEEFYRALLLLAGDLATFSAKSKRVAKLEPYRHDNLQLTFRSVFSVLRNLLGTVVSQSAIRLEMAQVEPRKKVAQLADRSLLESAVFVLGVKADLPGEKLRNSLAAQVKVGAVEAIQQLVNLHLPGVGLSALPTAPRQIPYHAGMIYFELQRGGTYWAQLEKSGGIAFHLAGEFPGLETELWAIKS